MRKEFLIERQGTTFALYKGLLAEAHEQGLISITTELLQIPSEQNNRVAIAKATVTLKKDEQIRVFEGIGDAAPNNVAPQMQTCTIRMAETRSKARALRDAINVGEVCLDELGPDAEEVPKSRPRQTRQETPRAAPAVEGSAPATKPNGLPAINMTGVQCPECKAPDKGRHVRTCWFAYPEKVA